MTLLCGQVVCPSNAATVIVAAASSADGSAVQGFPRRAVTISNPSAQAVYLGDAAVTSATGLLLAALTGSVQLFLAPNEAVYGRGASASPTVSFIETGT